MSLRSLPLLLVLLAVSLMTVEGQVTTFTANVEIRHPLMSNGFVAATLLYSYPDRQFKLDYAGQNYYEVFQYNTQRGYAPVSETDKPFLDQWAYKWGSSCTCETASIDAAMPQLFFDASSGLYDQVGDEQVGARVCTKYSRKTGSPSDVTTLWIDAATSEVCKFRFDDYRELTVSGFTPVNSIEATTFTPPDGCKCGKPVDIVMVLDRSGSISPTEFLDQKAFVDGFSQNFNYGPYEAAFSIVHFNTPAWTSLSLREGTNPDNVLAGVGDLQCCNDPNRPNSCCCCGTSISSGIRMGADEMKTGRSDAAHIMAVITDGYHNHDIYGNNCSGEASCRTDLAAAVSYAKAQVPNIIIYAVGVGADRDISADDLNIISDNHPERILRREDFSALANDNLELVARACQETVNPCGGCCGFCSCGQCLPPDGCDADSFCEVADVSGVCCKKAPKICEDTEPANLCFNPECDAVNNECISVPVVCKTNTTCFGYACDPTSGQCLTELKCEGDPECVVDTDCNDNNDCTVDICDPTDKICTWTPVTCDEPSMCETMACLPQGGCTLTPHPEDYCDDQNVCTVDVCDPALGCQHSTIPCADDDLCTDDVCDPFLGCRFTPKICPNPDDDESCQVSFCEDGACGFRDVSCPAGIAPEVVAGIGSAAVVGIIVAIVICLAALGGGGAYAYSQSAATGGVATVANNPIYVGSGSQGTNPLYQVQ